MRHESMDLQSALVPYAVRYVVPGAGGWLLLPVTYHYGLL